MKNEKKIVASNPLVSIITQVLNGSKYLEACIQSVLNQDYPYIEHIFIDGDSTDGTLNILAKYRDKYPGRIRFISEPDKGAGDAWNKGLRMAKGEIFGWLGSDDMSEPGAMRAVVEFFTSHSDAYFVFGECNIINERGEIISESRSKDFNLEEIINKGCYVATPSSFYRREVIEKVGSYDTRGNDLDFLIRAGKIFKIYRIEKKLSNFRKHENSQTGSRKTHKMWLRDDCIVSRRYGGSVFSGYCRRYYVFLIVEGLRPIFWSVYPFIERMIKRMKRND